MKDKGVRLGSRYSEGSSQNSRLCFGGSQAGVLRYFENDQMKRQPPGKGTDLDPPNKPATTAPELELHQGDHERYREQLEAEAALHHPKPSPEVLAALQAYLTPPPKLSLVGGQSRRKPLPRKADSDFESFFVVRGGA